MTVTVDIGTVHIETDLTAEQLGTLMELIAQEEAPRGASYSIGYVQSPKAPRMEVSEE